MKHQNQDVGWHVMEGRVQHLILNVKSCCLLSLSTLLSNFLWVQMQSFLTMLCFFVALFSAQFNFHQHSREKDFGDSFRGSQFYHPLWHWFRRSERWNITKILGTQYKVQFKIDKLTFSPILTLISLGIQLAVQWELHPPLPPPRPHCPHLWWPQLWSPPAQTRG